MPNELTRPQEQLGINLGTQSEVIRTFANLTMLNEIADQESNKSFQNVVAEHITHPFDVPTPKEKVKKRPDGFDYIESSWMDKQFKEHTPLYSTELLHFSEAMGWVTAIVRVTDRLTGNSELGGSSVRIQVRQGTTEPTFKDIIDKGNNVAAVITRAVKNAQSRFGHGADIYGKRESVRSNEENQRYESMLKEIQNISRNRAKLFEEGWSELGADFTEFLDKWQIYVDRNKPSTEANGYSVVDEVTVIDGNSSKSIKYKDVNKLKM